MRKKIALDECIPVRLIDWDSLRATGPTLPEMPKEEKEKDTYEHIGDVPIEKWIMSNPLYNICCRYKFKKAADLLSFSDEDWKEKPGIGKKSWLELKNILDLLRAYEGKNLEEEKPQAAVWDAFISYNTSLMQIKSLSVPVNKLLEPYGIMTVDDLLHYHPQDWQQLSKLGKWRKKEYMEAAEKFRGAMYHSMERELLRRYGESMTAAEVRPLLDWADRTYTSYKTLLSLLDKAGYPKGNKKWSELLCNNEETAQHMERCLLDTLEEEEFGALTVKDMEALFPGHLASAKWIRSVLKKLVQEKKVIRQGESYCLRYPSFYDFLGTMDEKVQIYVKGKLQGLTLDEIAEPNGVTRERVRQFLTRFIKQVPRVEEMRYMDKKIIWDGLTDDDFGYLFDLTPETVRFLDYYMDEKPGKLLVEERIEQLQQIEADTEVPEFVRKRAKERQIELCPVLETEDGPIRATHEDLIYYVFMKEGKEGISWQDLIDRCNELLHSQWPEWEEELRINYWYADKFIKSPELLVSRHKHLRYYDIQARDYSPLWDALQLSQYENMEITTRILFRDHPDLMKAYDIRDFYELHNLLKKCKVIEENKKEKALPVDMSCNLAPTILFGDVDREKQIYQVLRGKGTLTRAELSEEMEKAYGIAAPNLYSYNWKIALFEFRIGDMFEVDE